MAVVDVNVGDSFESFDKFKEIIDNRSSEMNEKLVIGKSSNKVTYTNSKLKGAFRFKEELVYTQVTFRCVHEGKFQSRGRLKLSTSLKNGCPVHIKLKAHRITNQLKVVSVELQHNHVLPPKSDGIYVQDRKLTETEQEDLCKLLNRGTPAHKIKEYFSSTHDKNVKVKDIHNFRQKLEKSANDGKTKEQRVWSSLEQMYEQDKGSHYSVLAQDGLISTIFFQTAHMRKLFQTYCDVLYIDSTYCLNQLGYPVIVFMIVDGDNVGQCVGYAIVRDEKMIMLSVLLKEFAEKSGVADVKTVIVDTVIDASEICALRLTMPDCQLVLCRFHVAKSFREAVVKYCIQGEREEMHRRLGKLLMCGSEETFFTCYKSISGELREYLDKNWLPVVNSWANFKTQHYVTWGNKTKKFVQRHERSLKTIASSKTTLPAFVNALLAFHKGEEVKFWRKVNYLSLRSEVFRPNFNGASSFLDRAHSLLLPSACTLLKQELDKVQEKVSFLSGNNLTVFKSNGTEKVYNLEGGVCQCQFFLDRRLPCWHLIDFCQKKGMDCLSFIPDRYSKQKYLECLDENNVVSMPPVSRGRDEVVEKGRKMSRLEKKVVMKALCKELESVGATCDEGEFDRRMLLLRTVLRSWKAGLIVHEEEAVDDDIVGVLDSIGSVGSSEEDGGLYGQPDGSLFHQPETSSQVDFSHSDQAGTSFEACVSHSDQAGTISEVDISHSDQPGTSSLIYFSHSDQTDIKSEAGISHSDQPGTTSIEVDRVSILGDAYAVEKDGFAKSVVRFKQKKKRGRPPKGKGVTSGHFCHKRKCSWAETSQPAKKSRKVGESKREVCGVCMRLTISEEAFGGVHYSDYSEWIDCSTCNTWYHCLCLGFSKPPEKYLCDQCIY